MAQPARNRDTAPPGQVGQPAADAAPAGTVDPSRPVALRVARCYLWLKDALDRYVALLALVALSPLLLLLAWRVRVDSPGPAFFAQRRAGRGGEPFTFYKFRTMRTDADPFGDSPTSGDDARITRLGRFLRESSLDELPQLINVLRGEMSLVGPRPLFVQQVASWTPRQRSRLQVKPGLTGFSQIHGRASIPIEEKLEWDVRYVQSVSLRTDLTVLWRTLSNVWNQAGLYQTRYSAERERFSEA